MNFRIVCVTPLCLRAAFVVAVAALGLGAALAETITLKSGKTIEAVVVSENARALKLRTADGEVEIPRSQIASRAQTQSHAEWAVHYEHLVKKSEDEARAWVAGLAPSTGPEQLQMEKFRGDLARRRATSIKAALVEADNFESSLPDKAIGILRQCRARYADDLTTTEQAHLIDGLKEAHWAKANALRRDMDFIDEQAVLVDMHRLDPTDVEVLAALRSNPADRTADSREILLSHFGPGGDVPAGLRRQDLSASRVLLRPVTQGEYVMAMVNWPAGYLAGEAKGTRETINQQLFLHSARSRFYDPGTKRHFRRVCYMPHACVMCNQTLKREVDLLARMVESLARQYKRQADLAAGLSTLSTMLEAYYMVEKHQIRAENTKTYIVEDTVPAAEGEGTEVVTRAVTVKETTADEILAGEFQRLSGEAATYFDEESRNKWDSLEDLFESYFHASLKTLAVQVREARALPE